MYWFAFCSWRMFFPGKGFWPNSSFLSALEKFCSSSCLMFLMKNLLSFTDNLPLPTPGKVIIFFYWCYIFFNFAFSLQKFDYDVFLEWISLCLSYITFTELPDLALLCLLSHLASFWLSFFQISFQPHSLSSPGILMAWILRLFLIVPKRFLRPYFYFLFFILSHFHYSVFNISWQLGKMVE